MNYIENYLETSAQISRSLNRSQILEMVLEFRKLRENSGRLFIIGVGGSAGNAGHAVNDFRKICNIEAYAPTDNVSEITARTNDEGWKTVFSNWLKVSKISKKDAILVLSVGGGDAERKISENIIEAVDLAHSVNAKIFAILGKSNGYAAKNADFAVVIPELDLELITPLSESYQSIIWHLIATHPILKVTQTMWESQMNVSAK